MSLEETLDEAIASWRAKHQIQENDPMLASVELVRIYLRYASPAPGDELDERPSYQEFRETVEALTKRAAAFSTQSLDLTVELRKIGDLRQWVHQPRTAVLIAVAFLSGLAGYLLGRL